MRRARDREQWVGCRCALGQTASVTTDDAALLIARDLLRSAGSVAVLTGAGISTDSGIPDFRGPNGVWTKDPAAEKLSTIQHYVNDPETRRNAWRWRLEGSMFRAEPNAGHRALVELERSGRLHTLVTQNIDGLHLMAGTPAERIVEIHGTVHRWECVDCGARGPMEEALERVRAGEVDPACPICRGIMKSATILFGQSLVTSDLQRAERAATEADVLLAVGTSLSVYPVAGMVEIAARAGRAVIIVNAQPTAMDDLATVVVQGSVSDLLPQLLGPSGGVAKT